MISSRERLRVTFEVVCTCGLEFPNGSTTSGEAGVIIAESTLPSRLPPNPMGVTGQESDGTLPVLILGTGGLCAVREADADAANATGADADGDDVDDKGE